MSERIYNFSAGPAAMPEPVLEQARDEMLDYRGSGMSVMEMSHRSSEFSEIIETTEADLREIFGVSDDYAVLFLQGGASTQFAMIPMNLAPDRASVDLVQTGSWTKKAAIEIEKIARLRIAGSSEKEKFRRIPPLDTLDLDPNAAYVHICSNNTIAGTQWTVFPETGNVPLVADMSSDILSRPIDLSRFGLIFAGAQKNLGPAGVTLVIIRKDLSDRAPDDLPTMLDYRTHIKARSLYNTPPTYGIYLVGLVMKWIKNEGGLVEIARRNENKARTLYEAVDSLDFYYCPVEKESRSRMNVVFRITGDDEELEKRFVTEAKAAGLCGLKGHRSVGGLRASIYNAVSEAAVEALVSFMKDFAARNG